MPPLNNLNPEGRHTWHSDSNVIAVLESTCIDISQTIYIIIYTEVLSEGQGTFKALLYKAVDDFIVHRDCLEWLWISKDCFSASISLHSSLESYAIKCPSSKTSSWNIDDAREQFRCQKETWKAKATTASQKTIIKVTQKYLYMYFIQLKLFDGSAELAIGGQYVLWHRIQETALDLRRVVQQILQRMRCSILSTYLSR